MNQHNGDNFEKEARHILALSGGKDSAALAVYMKEKHPELNLEYVFTDSGCELPETYEYLDRIRAVLNISITVIKTERNFDYWLKYYNGVLPSPQNRWCTRHLKLEPFEKYIGHEKTFSYVAIRADEKREGYRNTQGNIIPVHPFINDGITLNDVVEILKDSKLGLPAYYGWRKRSGCYFCFFQSKGEWINLRKYHPVEFNKACLYEENHSDGRVYTWRGNVGGKPSFLRELPDINRNEDEASMIEQPKENKLLQIIGKIDFPDIIDNRILKEA